MRLVRPSPSFRLVRSRRKPKLSPKANRRLARGLGIHLAHNSAKLKIINLPKHYPVVKVRPLRPRQDLAGPASPAVRWSVSQCSRIRGTMVLQTQNDDSIWPSRRSHSTCARLGPVSYTHLTLPTILRV